MKKNDKPVYDWVQWETGTNKIICNHSVNFRGLSAGIYKKKSNIESLWLLYTGCLVQNSV